MSFKEIKSTLEDMDEQSRLSAAHDIMDDTRKNVKSLGKKILNAYEKKQNEIARVKKLYEFDKQFGNIVIAGVDEVGRGPLAGPIVGAAVILELNVEKDLDLILGINDSKKLSSKKRQELSEIIKEKALAWEIASLDNNEIDKKGISWCNNEIFKIAISKLKKVPELVISDGYAVKGIGIKNHYIVKGDAQSASIACASIIAKVYRDNLMGEYAKSYSEYGFESNVGYGSKDHIDAIKKFGTTPIHRMSFLKNII
ncbi:ribonuclease HII [Clostridium acetobutylicum]|uniref:Ribonuclease HII n=1 Tax=Clostridium acetobutylicum (strain ATCC 824 / DSM 792 / JCM 1419 / IAM 19013 / LMG 5710 / NBRC 13948 / NRRL B-527 / VKM B-1787 / 2291 / W) TaxID=272562 RepID=RNH2_CLOAB|nr:MULTISPECIES: ribonuclease HII [Clostridium]Q97I90.1 RecName: Full=Ribonuclease HII; Short=RNase HII [Clostridium acetobutylicum ATCC 824]AAK79728.1 Ribonuclease HII [Clostridium acetobutylicum ATCC 824]ADZ20812.1 ribonuclease HII [Clostridium acetobutylicum EA 2018]AEI33061.1 ribonuclease HII [Clostridium acetobutylicum DSM 1731]AWV79837.1 ribonuclease HII [Clostridium acetobutylicum]KHD38053.1 ribonuclease HII [Clostridium acetobutylicum]